MRVLQIAAVITFFLIILLILLIFYLKLYKKIKSYLNKRLDRKIYRILYAYEKGEFKKDSYEITQIKGANFWGADLEKADLKKTDLRKSNFFGANLKEANLEKGNLEDANLSGANLTGANLSFANLKRANLQGANLQGANLQGANLLGADLEGADFERANLKDAHLAGVSIENVQFIVKDRKQRQKALHKLIKLRQKKLLQALEISKKDFQEDTTQIILKIAVDKNIHQSLGTKLLNPRKNKWKRVEAAYELTNFGLRAIDYLAQAIDSKDQDIAFNSAQALSLIKTKETFAILLYHLPKLKQFSQSRIADLLQDYIDIGYEILNKSTFDKEGIIRYWTAYLLGRYKARNSLLLLQKLAGDPNDNVRTNAAESLGSLGYEEASSKLIELLDDKAWFVRNHAIKSLKELGIKQSASKVALLLKDKNWWIRENATEALISFGRESIPILIPMLDDKDKFARNRAAEILGRLGFIDEKIKLLKEEPQNEKVIFLLRKIWLAGATGVFEKYLKSKDTTLKHQVERVVETK